MISGSDSAPLELEGRIVAAIRRLMRAVDLHSRKLVEEHGLTGPQLATMQELQKAGPVASSVLARLVHLSGPTVTGILNRLEKRGFIERTRGEHDRRTVLVSLTELGTQVLQRAPSLLQDRFRWELSRLAEWEQLSILASLQRIASMMDAESLDAAPHLVADARSLEPEPLVEVDPLPASPTPPASTAAPTPGPPAPSPGRRTPSPRTRARRNPDSDAQ